MDNKSRFEQMSEEQRGKILEELRNEVDNIDKQLVDLLNKRTMRSILIGRIKRSLNQPTYSPEREKEINQKIQNYLKEPMRHEALWRIYERILDQSRAIQREEAEKGEIYNVPIPRIESKEIRKFLSAGEWKIIAGFFTGIFLLFIYLFFSTNTAAKTLPVVFDVRPGESTTLVLDRLEESGLIPSKTMMKISLIISGNASQIKAARYTIRKSMSYMGLASLFASDKADQIIKVNFYDGISNNGIAAVLEFERVNKKELMLAAFNDTAFGRKYTGKLNSLRGFLLPGDYYFYRNSGPEEIMDSMFVHWKKAITPDMKKNAETMGRNIQELTILASIIDAETNYRAEMKRVSGVYHNRLKIGMPLQADPTVQFIAPLGTKRITQKELRIKSPYNTYIYAGLPPGPINNPGRAALEAAFLPEKHSYLYFVADGGTGRHLFSKTFSEHQRLAQKYHKWLKSIKK